MQLKFQLKRIGKEWGLRYEKGDTMGFGVLSSRTKAEVRMMTLFHKWLQGKDEFYVTFEVDDEKSSKLDMC